MVHGERLWAGLLGLLIVHAVAYSQNATGWFSETQHDFGFVPRGAILVHRFRWENTTAGELRISEIHTSCSQVHAQALPRVLQPGESGHVEVEVDGRQLVGEKTAWVRVQIEPGSRVVMLAVRACWLQEVSVQPGSLRFGCDCGDSGAEQSLDIVYTGPNDWRIVAVQNPYPFLAMHVEPTQRRPGEISYRLTARLRQPAPVGDWMVPVWLQTNDPAVPRVAVPVEGHVRPEIVASPACISFAAGEPSGSQQRIILRGKQPFRILGVHDIPMGIEVEPGSDRAQAVHIVIVRWMASPSAAGKSVIRLATDCPSQPTVEIPVNVSTQQP
jgi:hypothetical protein